MGFREKDIEEMQFPDFLRYGYLFYNCGVFITYCYYGDLDKNCVYYKAMSLLENHIPLRKEILLCSAQINDDFDLVFVRNSTIPGLGQIEYDMDFSNIVNGERQYSPDIINEMKKMNIKNDRSNFISYAYGEGFALQTLRNYNNVTSRNKNELGIANSLIEQINETPIYGNKYICIDKISNNNNALCENNFTKMNWLKYDQMHAFLKYFSNIFLFVFKDKIDRKSDLFLHINNKCKEKNFDTVWFSIKESDIDYFSGIINVKSDKFKSNYTQYVIHLMCDGNDFFVSDNFHNTDENKISKLRSKTDVSLKRKW